MHVKKTVWYSVVQQLSGEGWWESRICGLRSTKREGD